MYLFLLFRKDGVLYKPEPNFYIWKFQHHHYILVYHQVQLMQDCEEKIYTLLSLIDNVLYDIPIEMFAFSTIHFCVCIMYYYASKTQLCGSEFGIIKISHPKYEYEAVWYE